MTDVSTFRPGRRIAVLGTSGCGKTFVARRLAELLGVPYICSDAIFWGPNWTETPVAQRIVEYERVTRADAWTFDGNIDGMSDNKGPVILQRADTLIWLDLPRWQVFVQVFGRTVKRSWTGEPLWHNNSESWRKSFFSRESILLWSMQTYTRRKIKYQALFADPDYAQLNKLRLTSRRQVNAWLASLQRPIA